MLPCRFWCNDKGGVTGDLGVRYIRSCIEPCLPDLSPDNPALLLMDGQGSHFTLELLRYCRTIGLHVLLRPPHTTHILQGEDVVHFHVFKGKYHQAKLLALGKKIFAQGSFRLTAADLLAVAKGPWEEAFSVENCAKAWARIGISPFDQRVYWDLLEKEKKATAVALDNKLNPELMTLKGMVKIMFNIEETDPPPPPGDTTALVPAAGDTTALVPAGQQKRKRETLNSSDLWDLPGGATGDECFEIVKMKVEAREEKAKATAAKKTAAAEKKTEIKAAALEYGAQLAGCLTDASHIKKLSVAQLHATLTFKAVEFPKAALKADLQSLLESNLSLPSAESPPLLALPAPSASAPVPKGKACAPPPPRPGPQVQATPLVRMGLAVMIVMRMTSKSI